MKAIDLGRPPLVSGRGDGDAEALSQALFRHFELLAIASDILGEINQRLAVPYWSLERLHEIGPSLSVSYIMNSSDGRAVWN